MREFHEGSEQGQEVLDMCLHLLLHGIGIIISIEVDFHPTNVVVVCRKRLLYGCQQLHRRRTSVIQEPHQLPQLLKLWIHIREEVREVGVGLG